MKILQTACDPSVSKDKSLPYSAFLVEYIEGDIHKFDLVISAKQSEIFDHYWDKYKKISLILLSQTEEQTLNFGIQIHLKKKVKWVSLVDLVVIKILFVFNTGNLDLILK